MKARFAIFWEQARWSEKVLLGLLCFPLLLSFHWAYTPALPFWILGAAQSVVSWRTALRFPRLSRSALWSGAILAGVGNAGVQLGWLDGRFAVWTLQLVWFLLGSVAGQQFFVLSTPEDDLPRPVRRLKKL